MSTRIPSHEQYLVFWIDPVKTLETHGDDDDPELLEAVSKLPSKKYVGYVRTGILKVLPNRARPWTLFFLASGNVPTCPTIHLQEDMFVAVEPSTRTDLSHEPLRVSPELPWKDAFLPVFFSCNVLCHSYDSDATPPTASYLEDLRRGKIARLFVDRRDLLFCPDAGDCDCEPEVVDPLASDESSCEEETSSTGFDSEDDPDPVRAAMMAAIESDPQAKLWWSMVDDSRDYGEWPYVQVSPDLSLVDKLPDPFEFARERQALLDTVTAHKAKKVIAARQKDELDYGHIKHVRLRCWKRLLRWGNFKNSKTTANDASNGRDILQKLDGELSRVSAFFNKLFKTTFISNRNATTP